MTEKELIMKAGEKLDAVLAEAKKTGNLVVKDATDDKAVIRATFKKGKGILRLFPAFVPRQFGKAGRRLKQNSRCQKQPPPSDLLHFRPSSLLAGFRGRGKPRVPCRLKKRLLRNYNILCQV